MSCQPWRMSIALKSAGSIFRAQHVKCFLMAHLVVRTDSGRTISILSLQNGIAIIVIRLNRKDRS